MEDTLTIGLFDPGMTHLHRVGLAGLYMTLNSFEKNGIGFEGASWTINTTQVRLSWRTDTDFLGQFLKKAFSVREDGLIQVWCHQAVGMGDLERIQYHNAVLDTFLQHPKSKNIRKGSDQSRYIDFGENQIAVQYRTLKADYAHCSVAGKMRQKSGKLAKSVVVKGWLYPGAAERHSNLSGTEIEESPGHALCLVFAPAGSLFFSIFHRGTDGKRDKRRGTAIVIPHIRNLKEYTTAYLRYLSSPIERLNADGLGDAGLNALVSLKGEEKMLELGISGFSSIMMGTVNWSSRQKTRTSALDIENVDDRTLDLFDLARSCLPNKMIIRIPKATKKDPTPANRYFVATSLCRGVIAENIAASREWYAGFSELMKTKKLSQLVFYEKGGLKEMVEKIQWNKDADRKLVEAVHVAISRRYGALAAQASKRGERIPFDREYERMRTGLMRAKNRQTLRGELADLFARGGINKKLQTDWPEILPLFTGDDWQRARDLALLALASYTGKGADEIEQKTNEEDEEEE